MIAKLNGILIEKTPPQVVIDCNGVGYEVEVPMSTFYNLPEIGSKLQLQIYMVVREDAQLLYGFGSDQEKSTFKQLLKVNGIGAKSALSILSGVSIDDLVQAVNSQDVAMLVRVPGVGKKTAERLLLELKDKFSYDGIFLPPCFSLSLSLLWPWAIGVIARASHRRCSRQYRHEDDLSAKYGLTVIQL